MPIRMRADDGTVQTFPDGTTPESVRFAMTAYNNKDTWGGLAGKVGRAVDQTAVSIDDRSFSAPGSIGSAGLTNGIGPGFGQENDLNDLKKLIGEPIELPADLDEQVVNYGQSNQSATTLGFPEGGITAYKQPASSIDSASDGRLDFEHAGGETVRGNPNDPNDPVTVTAAPFRGVYPTTEPIYADGINSTISFNGTVPVDGQRPYLVSRTIIRMGDHGLQAGKHTFVVVADPHTGEKSWEAHYGPSGPLYAPGQLVELRGLPMNSTISDDEASWQARNDPSGRWLTHIEQIPASPGEVIKQGRILDQYLGTPDRPGHTPYLAVPRSGLNASNSNTAATTLANRAVRSENPHSPFLVPPDGLFTDQVVPGWNHSIDGPGNVPDTGPMRLLPIPDQWKWR